MVYLRNIYTNTLHKGDDDDDDDNDDDDDDDDNNNNNANYSFFFIRIPNNAPVIATIKRIFMSTDTTTVVYV